MDNPSPNRPVLAVGAVILDESDHVVLVRRGQEPQIGRWSIPGGKVHWGELLVDAVRREVREETGLEVQIGPIVETVERITRTTTGDARYHYIIVDFLCTMAGGVLRADSDAADAVLVPVNAMTELDLIEGTAAVIEKAQSLYHSRAAKS